MAIKFKAGFSVFTISIMAFGAVNALMSGLTFCLSESKCFVTMYLVVMAVIAVAELVAAFVFSIKSSRDKIVNAMEDHVVRYQAGFNSLLATYHRAPALIVSLRTKS